MKLDGKVAIVTGAGRGLGLAYATALAQAGAAVVVNDADKDAAYEAAEGITVAGGRAVAHPAPVGGTEAAEGLVAAAVDAFGRLDILVTNVGILRDKVLWKMTDDEFDAVVGVHRSYPREIAVAFADGGWTPETIAENWASSLGRTPETVGIPAPQAPDPRVAKSEKPSSLQAVILEGRRPA